MCDIGTMASTDIVWESQPKARKQHTCCECGSIINPGEPYELIKGVWDGEFSTFKTCSFCSNVRSFAFHDLDINSDEGIAFGSLWECVGHDYGTNMMNAQ